MSQINNQIDALAMCLHDWLCQRMGAQEVPSSEEILTVIKKNLKELGVVLAGTVEEQKVAALLKPRPDASLSKNKRIRELAGIPHKGNFV